MTSAMRQTMDRQPADLRRIVADPAPAQRAAERLAGRRLYIVGTGTSWHAANHGAYLLRDAGVDAVAVQAMDAALDGRVPTAADALVLLTHRNTKRYATIVRDRAAALGVPTVIVSGIGAGGDVETVAPETSAAFTASHLGCLARLAQIAGALGGTLDLSGVADAVAAALAGAGPRVAPPGRLLEFTGAGSNQWTAAEGALKVRETAYVAAEGLAVEQLYHGPSVALQAGDTLVALDGGGPGGERVREIAAAAGRFGVTVAHVVETGLPEPLSIFPLTVAVQRIALEVAEALGTNPDSFGKDRPGAVEAWGSVGL